MEDEAVIENRIGQDFTTVGLFKFALPGFLMQMFNQVYRSLDDALFISRYVGEKALAGFNILNPITCIQLALNHLFSLGSSNISARLMGEGKQKEAKQIFSRMVISAFVFGCVFALVINLFSNQLFMLLGANEELKSYAIYQLRIVLSLTPLTLVAGVYTNYYATAGKPKMGMICSIVQGVINIGLDYLLIVRLNYGIIGAAIATAVGEIAIFVIGTIFYLNKNNEIYFVKPNGEYLITCLECFKYAIPQFINSLSIAVCTLYTNYLLLDYIGSTGIAANAIITDIRAIITAGLVGIAISTAPIVAYNYGNKNIERLRKILKSILIIALVGSTALICFGLLMRKPFIQIFMSKESSQAFYDMSYLGLTIEIFSMPFIAGCVQTSRIFIAFGNTKTASFISIFRNLIFKIIVLFIMPRLLGTLGIWLAVPMGEGISFLLCAILLYINRNNYGYGKSKEARLINN